MTLADIAATCAPPGSFFLNMPSIRWVTRNPPNVLTATRATAMAPRIAAGPAEVLEPAAEDGADDDHRADGVGHAHERRVQRGRDVPDHVVADEDGQDEDGDVDDVGSTAPVMR